MIFSLTKPKTKAMKERPSLGKILLVDDDLILLEIGNASLQKAGFGVDLARNGREAISRLNQSSYDLVVTDLEMPELDGFELIEQIRSREDSKYLPVIVITGTEVSTSLERAYSVGATSFVSKPINWQALFHHVRYVLRASRQKAKLRDAMEEIESASRLKSNLLSIVTHEFRSPLHVVMGFSELLADDAGDPQGAAKRKEYAQHVRIAARQLDNVLSDMLVFSHLFSDEQPLQDDDYPVSDLVEQCLKIVLETSADRRIQIVDSIPNGAGACLLCDRSLVVRALTHLLQNAVKFSPADSAVIVNSQVLENGDICLAVQDHGPGMDTKQSERMMKPFVQGDMSYSRSNEGIGIGLPLSKLIAEAHGGRLMLHSTLNEGTVAALVFPAERSRIAPIERERIVPTAGISAQTQRTGSHT